MSALMSPSIGGSASLLSGVAPNAQSGVVSDAVSDVVSADRSTLAQQWHALFRRDPPAHVQVALMRRVLAWHAQLQASPLAAKGLDIAVSPRPVQPRSGPALVPGTRLLREWQGATHEVLVLDKGFEYQGKTYGSLSAIARTITGTPWSGPAFFGVKR